MVKGLGKYWWGRNCSIGGGGGNVERYSGYKSRGRGVKQSFGNTVGEKGDFYLGFSGTPVDFASKKKKLGGVVVAS